MLLLVEEPAIYSQAHTKDTNALFKQNLGFCSLKHLVQRVTAVNLGVNAVSLSVLQQTSLVLRREIAEF
jgi:hypothetical protein